MSSSGKQYGLQIPKKSSHGVVQKHSAFGDDSESDKEDGGGTDWTKRALKSSEKTSVKRQTKIDMQRALEQDATVYQYDEIYDQMEKNKHDKNQKEKERKPRYIQKLLVNAEKRKIESERRIERQVQKEREAEGEEFKDKETFVTAAYKKKLEEFAKLDAEQKRQDMLEEIGDVTKQQDMGGFYRHLYQTTVSGPQEETPPKTSNNSAVATTKDDKIENKKNSEKTVKKDTRHYRKKKTSESDGDKETKDADTDVGSSSSSSSEDETESGEAKSSNSETEDPKRIRSKPSKPSTNETPSSNDLRKQPEVPQPSEPERNIWEKRTVGSVFDAALKRYFERKKQRSVVVV